MRSETERFGVGIRGAGQVACEHAKAVENNPHPFQQEIDDLVNGILYGTPIISYVPDARNSMEMVLAMERSAATGKPVKVGRGSCASTGGHAAAMDQTRKDI